MENALSAFGKLAVTVVDLGADPLVFTFQPDPSLAPLVQVSVSRHFWLVLGPSRAMSYVTDRFLLAYPAAAPPRDGLTYATACSAPSSARRRPWASPRAGSYPAGGLTGGQASLFVLC